MTRDTLYLEHAIHDGLFQARYRDRFRFAIMWENQKRRSDAQSGVANETDLLENLLPFWMEQYFTKPNYLVVDGKPVLFVYHTEVMIQDLGGIDATRRAVEKMREACTRAGFDGLAIMGEHRGTNWQYLEDMKACGFDAAFAYCWHSAERFPTIEAAFDQQIEKMKAWADKSILPFPPTATVGWDPMPWSRTDGRAPWLHPDKITRWYSKPEEFIHLLQRVKEFTDAFPANSLTQRMLLLDNWNEWGEGHFLSPHAAAGFGYLQAVRDVFTARDNLPDYRTPQMLGLGPYGPDTI